MAITLAITTAAGQNLAHYRLQQGSPLRLAAVDKVYYLLADDMGLAPPNIQANRAGNDLFVQFADGE